MTIHLTDSGVIELQGPCPSEDADVLLQLLLSHPAASVDWRACESAHTAVIQLLLQANRQIKGTPNSQALRQWIQPILAARPAAKP